MTHWKNLFLPWWVHDEYTLKAPKGFKLTDEEEAIRRKYDLTLDQMYWRRVTIEDEFRGLIEDFDQQYPDSWEKAFKAMNRTLFLFVLVFVAALLFRAYAAKEIIAEFGTGAPLPPAPELKLNPAFIPQTEIPCPQVPVAPPPKPDKDSEAEILADLALTARDRLNCSITHKTSGIIKGVQFYRTRDEIRIVTNWGPPVQLRSISLRDIDFAKSHLPE